MGLFNFLETFFIISLAIMFVLVGLLMYHIRTRLNASEQRIDTLYEIVTNLSNEINAQKVHIANLQYGGAGAPNMVPFQPAVSGSVSGAIVKKIIVSDDEGDDDDATDDEDHDATDDEEVYEDEDIVSDADEEDELDIDVTIEDGEEHQENLNEHSLDNVHVIKLYSDVSANDFEYEVDVDVDLDVAISTPSAMEAAMDEVVSAIVDDSVSVTAGTATEDPVSAVASDAEIIALETTATAAATTEDEVSIGSISETDDAEEHVASAAVNYQKLSVSKLKKLAEKRGLSNTRDISHMKKAELISILQEE